MIDYENYLRIKTCHARDRLTAPQIARKLALDVRTVERWLLLPRFSLPEFLLSEIEW